MVTRPNSDNIYDTICTNSSMNCFCFFLGHFSVIENFLVMTENKFTNLVEIIKKLKSDYESSEIIRHLTEVSERKINSRV